MADLMGMWGRLIRAEVSGMSASPATAQALSAVVLMVVQEQSLELAVEIRGLTGEQTKFCEYMYIYLIFHFFCRRDEIRESPKTDLEILAGA